MSGKSMSEAIALMLWHVSSLRESDMDIPEVGNAILTMVSDSLPECYVEMATPMEGGDEMISRYRVTVEEVL